MAKIWQSVCVVEICLNKRLGNVELNRINYYLRPRALISDRTWKLHIDKIVHNFFQKWVIIIRSNLKYLQNFLCEKISIIYSTQMILKFVTTISQINIILHSFEMILKILNYCFKNIKTWCSTSKNAPNTARPLGCCAAVAISGNFVS